MAIGALIGAYQEDDGGGLRCLLPLAGRTLVEYQARCAAAAATAPIVVVVERVPQALQDAFERLRLDGIGVFPVSDVNEAVSRFETGSMILLIGDGVAPPVGLVAEVAAQSESIVATVPDDEFHEAFERIDGATRWAGVALVDARLLGSTAAMLGDWDLQSTLLRRAIQDGARRLPIAQRSAEPLLVENADQLADFQRHLVRASRSPRSDCVSRYVLPPVEDFATEQLMETAVRPAWLASRRKSIAPGEAKEDSSSIGTRNAPQEPTMTNAFAQAAAFALAALVTVSTVFGTNAIAGSQFARGDAAVGMQVLAAQTVVVVGHRA